MASVRPVCRNYWDQAAPFVHATFVTTRADSRRPSVVVDNSDGPMDRLLADPVDSRARLDVPMDRLDPMGLRIAPVP